MNFKWWIWLDAKVTNFARNEGGTFLEPKDVTLELYLRVPKNGPYTVNSYKNFHKNIDDSLRSLTIILKEILIFISDATVIIVCQNAI